MNNGTYARRALHCLLAVSLASAAAVAHADDDTGFYAGVSENWISADYEDRDDLSYDDSDAAFEIRGGYMFTDNFGLEVGYLDLGDYTADGDGPANRIDVDADAFSFAGVASVALADRVDLYGKLGAYRVEADRTSIAGAEVLLDNDEDTAAFAALGLEYDFGAFNVIGQYALADTDVHELDMDIASLGLKYEFGGQSR